MRAFKDWANGKFLRAEKGDIYVSCLGTKFTGQSWRARGSFGARSLVEVPLGAYVFYPECLVGIAAGLKNVKDKLCFRNLCIRAELMGVWNEKESLVGLQNVPEKVVISARQAGGLYCFPALKLFGADKNNFISVSAAFTISLNFTIAS